MNCQQLRLSELETRATPAAGSSCPPQDPMDNPPPVQPAPKDDSGSGKVGKTLTKTISTTTAAVTTFIASTPTATAPATKTAYTVG